MPVQTIPVEPDLFLDHGGLKVFHTYKDDDVDQGMHRYQFTLSPDCSAEENGCGNAPCPHVFDVEQLSTWQRPEQPAFCMGANDTPENRAAWERYWEEEQAAVRRAIMAAIDQGLLPRLHG